jgi:hypothetical protein
MPFDPYTCLNWYEISPEYKPDKHKGYSFLMLAYCVDDLVIEMGQVAVTSTNEYWWFTTNPNIHCKHTASSHYKYPEDAREALGDYVASEIIRMRNLDTPVFNHDLPKVVWCKSDEKARADSDYDIGGFQAGMDWALRTSGVPRKPTWATYIVQNRDRSLTWFECKPTYHHNDGKWICDEGRSEVVILYDSQWSKAIKRIK